MKSIKFGIVLLPAVAACAIGLASHASADAHVCISGAGDTTSEGLANEKAAQGDPCDVPIQWPADVAHVQSSLDVAVPAAVKAYYDAGGAQGTKVTVEGWSLGSIAASQTGDAIRVQNGGKVPENLTVITNGNPYGDSGMANDNGVAGVIYKVAAPFVGAPETVPQMGINRNNRFDPWGNTAGQPPQSQIAQIGAVGQNHMIPDPRTKHDSYVTHDPVTDSDVRNEVYNPTGEQNPISAAADTAGTPVDPASSAFLDVTFPVSNPADDPLATIKSDVPSFPGELQCPGGYFTPGDAPC
jgi:hypothetical protein